MLAEDNLAVVEWDDTPPRIKALIKAACEPFKYSPDTAREALARNVFLKTWFHYDQGQTFKLNWHHSYVAQIYYDVLTGVRQNVVVNQPPGSSKSEAWCIFLPAQASVNFDRVRILTLSYSKSLVDEHANRVKALMGSVEFQELWPRKFGRTNTENFTLENSKGKTVFQAFARSMEGQVTGVRAGYMVPGYSGHIMIDDPQKPVDMLSTVRRTKSNQVLVSTIRSRRALDTTPVILVQQRLHTEDASGFALSGKTGLKFDHINIPALITTDYLDSLPEDVAQRCWESIKDSPSRVIAGVRYWSYWPEKESVDDLLALWDADDYTFLSQYMQNPKALTGGLVDTDWFSRYDNSKPLPPLAWRAVYVDTNSGKVKDHLDYTVFTLAGMDAAGNLYILDVERGRWDSADLLDKAEEVWNRWRPTNVKRPAPLRYMAIEDKQAGQGLIATLEKRASIPIEAVQRGTDQNKLIRCKNVVPMIKTGRVWLPLHDDLPVMYWDETRASAKADWLLPTLKECADFSADDSHDYDDIFDTIMDAIDDGLISANVPLSAWVSRE